MTIRHVLLFLTYRCSLRCHFCLSFNRYWNADPSLALPTALDPAAFIRPNKDIREMSTSDIVGRVIPQCEKAGVEAIALSGGEVLLRKDAVEIFRALGSTPMRWCFDSNLMLCNEAVAEAAISANCSAVFFSLDGTRETHNRLRGNPKAFDKTLFGLRNLLDARRRADRACVLALNFVLQPGNEREPVSMIDLALDLGVDEVGFQLLSARSFNAWFDDQTAAASLRVALAHAIDHGIKASVYPLNHSDSKALRAWYSHPTDDRFFQGCGYIHSNLRIDPAGNVIPCMEYRLGNVLEQDLVDIWNGHPYQTFRQKLKSHGPFQACLRCCNMNS